MGAISGLKNKKQKSAIMTESIQNNSTRMWASYAILSLQLQSVNSKQQCELQYIDHKPLLRKELSCAPIYSTVCQTMLTQTGFKGHCKFIFHRKTYSAVRLSSATKIRQAKAIIMPNTSVSCVQVFQVMSSQKMSKIPSINNEKTQHCK